jgi:hypothetical protein
MLLSKRCTALAATLLAACATTTAPRIDPALPAEQVLLALNAQKITARSSTADPVFRLGELREHLRPLIKRCVADGGQFVVTSSANVRFLPRVPSAPGPVESTALLPRKIVCQKPTGYSWGASISYPNSTFFYSNWAEELFYYATVALAYVPAMSFELVEPTSASNTAAAAKERSRCAAQREAYNTRVRSKPEVGMQVAFGMITELRPPLALVQYDTFGRQRKRKDQEWVQISSLSAGSDCPA